MDSPQNRRMYCRATKPLISARPTLRAIRSGFQITSARTMFCSTSGRPGAGHAARKTPILLRPLTSIKIAGSMFFGVSLDKDKASWVKAINDDGLQWPQVSDLAFWDTEAPALYGVRFIPSNLLIDP